MNNSSCTSFSCNTALFTQKSWTMLKISYPTDMMHVKPSSWLWIKIAISFRRCGTLRVIWRPTRVQKNKMRRTRMRTVTSSKEPNIDILPIQRLIKLSMLLQHFYYAFYQSLVKKWLSLIILYWKHVMCCLWLDCMCHILYNEGN